MTLTGELLRDVLAFCARLHVFPSVYLIRGLHLCSLLNHHNKKNTLLTITDNKPRVPMQKEEHTYDFLLFFQPNCVYAPSHTTSNLLSPGGSYMLQMVLECEQLKEFIVGFSGCSTSQPRTI